MMLTPGWYQLRHHAEQAEAYRCRSRFVYIVAGRGGGKSEIACRKIVRHLPVRRPFRPALYFYAGPTRQQVKKIAWDRCLSLIPKAWLLGKPSLSELIIKTVFGSELHLVSLDEPARIEGVQWDGGVIDERSEVWPKTVDISVMPALSSRMGWLWQIGAPKRAGVGAQEFKTNFRKAQRGELPDTTAFQWSAEDVIPLAAREHAARTFDARDYAEQIGGEWQEISGGIFYNFSRELNLRKCSLDPRKPIWIGSDFNVDPMAWVFAQEVEGRLYVFDELYLHNANTPMALEIAWQRYGTHPGGFAFYGDATGSARKTAARDTDYTHIQKHEGFALRGRAIRYPDSNPPVADRYAAVNALLRNARGDCRLFIDPACVHLIEDLESCLYKAGSREASKIGTLTHASDALGYIVCQEFPIGFDTDSLCDIRILNEVSYA